MKQKLKNIGDACLNGFGRVVESPYRMVMFGLFIVIMKDVFQKANKGVLDFIITKYGKVATITQGMGFDILALIVLLIALIVYILKNAKPSSG